MSIQYTIRNIPPEVDKALKLRAASSKKSFNQTVVDELSKNIRTQVGINGHKRFEWLAGTMDDEEAKKFDAAIENLNKVDPDFWK